jgi:hypothetical protein
MTKILQPWDQNLRVLSPPMHIVWAGFQAHSHKLQSQGWEFAVEQCDYDLSFVIIMRHKELQVHGISDNISTRLLMDHNRVDSPPLGPIHMRLVHELKMSEPSLQRISMVSEIVDMADHITIADPYSIDGFFAKYESSCDTRIVIPHEAQEQALELLARFQTTPEERASQFLQARRLDIATPKRVKAMVDTGDIATKTIAEIRVPK